ncbi:uncharacterized protein LOC129216691 [Uloborus diversus]|uniref:uncharacterized protein LOC129216691 n=1 Tax=Uloborus diversus TaxID=327109 RepID=UPI002409C1A2|nr:uncharacterized protein LOC129216691 [Uloborus diversus]
MDSYFLFVFKGLLSEEQRTSACDHIQSLLPSFYDYELGLSLASPIAPLLMTGYSYVSVLNPLAEADSKWMRVSSRDELLSTLGSLQEPEPTDTSEFDLISAHIHELADLLPTFGNYKLDVFITSDILEVASIEDMPTLASALYRLQWWHGARTKILLPTGRDLCNIESWLEIMDATVLDKNSQNAGPSLWRGCLELQALEVMQKNVAGWWNTINWSVLLGEENSPSLIYGFH